MWVMCYLDNEIKVILGLYNTLNILCYTQNPR